MLDTPPSRVIIGESHQERADRLLIEATPELNAPFSCVEVLDDDGLVTVWTWDFEAHWKRLGIDLELGGARSETVDQLHQSGHPVSMS